MNSIQVFSPEWFEHHQEKLLWLLNHKVLGRWFRWVLRIRKSDIGYDKLIIHIYPHAYTVFLRRLDEENIEVATDFRTHDKFAKRLRYAFNEFWWLAHFWDWAMADRWVLDLSFGFSTFTSYPDPSTGGSGCDGHVGLTVDGSFSTLRDGSGNQKDEVAASDLIPDMASSGVTNQFSRIDRGIFIFSTAFSGFVSSAIFSIFGQGTSNGLGNQDLYVAGATTAFTSSLDVSDYQNVGRILFASVLFANYIGGYNDFSLNNAGVLSIAKPGFTAFSTQLSSDFNNVAPTWVSTSTSGFQNVFADQAGTTQDPKLVIVYSSYARLGQGNNLRPRLFGPGFAR